MPCVRCIYIVSMIVVQQLVRTYRHSPCIIRQLSKAVSVGLGIIPGVTLHILMDIQGPLISAVAAVGKLLDSLTSSIHFSLHVVKLSVAFCIDLCCICVSLPTAYAIGRYFPSITIPVSHRCDVAVLIIAEGLGISFRIGLGIAQTIGIFDQVLSII